MCKCFHNHRFFTSISPDRISLSSLFVLIVAGVFLGVSSNTRYQIINGLEHLVEVSPIAKRVPAASLVFTVGVRFANNVYGGMQFADWARMSGCQ
jgi:hypothetical protein